MIGCLCLGVAFGMVVKPFRRFFLLIYSEEVVRHGSMLLDHDRLDSDR